VDVHNTLVNNALLRWANEDQKRRYLPRLAKDTVGSFAISEAESGSDAFALATVAVDQGGHFVLNGRKLWITSAAESGLFLLFANAKPEAGYRGITAFLIERDFHGFQVGRKEDKLGIRASSTCELLLDDCRVVAHSRSRISASVKLGCCHPASQLLFHGPCDFALRSLPLLHPLHLSRSRSLRGNLPGPRTAHPESLRQLRQTSLSPNRRK